MPLSSRNGNLKVSKLSSECGANKVQEYTKYSDNDVDANLARVLEDIEDEKRLSCSVDEIEEFEREFVLPMKKSVSFMNINLKSGHAPHTGGTEKYCSIGTLLENENSLESYNLGKELNSFSESLSSELDSGVYSRESTQDLSFISSIADASESLVFPSLISEPLVMYFEPLVIQSKPLMKPNNSKTTRFTKLDKSSTLTQYQPGGLPYTNDLHKDSWPGFKKNIFSSTPKQKKKLVLSKSQSLKNTKPPAVLTRSTTSVGQIWSMPAVPVSVVTWTGPCLVGCNAEVTVNGVCYHS